MSSSGICCHTTFCTNPSKTAVLPTPESPMTSTLGLLKRQSISMILLISVSRPTKRSFSFGGFTCAFLWIQYFCKKLFFFFTGGSSAVLEKMVPLTVWSFRSSARETGKVFIWSKLKATPGLLMATITAKRLISSSKRLSATSFASVKMVSMTSSGSQL